LAFGARPLRNHSAAINIFAPCTAADADGRVTGGFGGKKIAQSVAQPDFRGQDLMEKIAQRVAQPVFLVKINTQLIPWKKAQEYALLL
jgi:hypothetical protein